MEQFVSNDARRASLSAAKASENASALSPLRSVGLLYTPATKQAMHICFDAHIGQTDKGGMPYALHPIHLAEQMETEDEVCAALLHDILEDTDHTEESLRQLGVSEPVLEALRLLTHEPGVPYLEYVTGTRHNPMARKIKQADLLHNCELGRLDHPTKYDMRRRRKYRMAQIILAEDHVDPISGLYFKKFPLDDLEQYFLSVYYTASDDATAALTARVKFFRLTAQTTTFSFHDLDPAAAQRLHDTLDTDPTKPTRSLPEALAHYLEKHTWAQVCQLLDAIL